MSTARRCLKSPRSLSGTSTQPTMVTQVNIMVMNGWLASFSFIVNRLPHSWHKAISDSDLETPRSRSWVWSKGKVIQLAQYHIKSLPFHLTSIRPTILQVELFRNLTLKFLQRRTRTRRKQTENIKSRTGWLNWYGEDCTPVMKNSSSEFTKTHKIARNWNFIKYKSIQISTNAFINSSNVEVDEMGWITVISHSLLYMESHIRG